MRIRVAQHSGFCFGVKRAINIVESILKESKDKIYSLGPLIHNPQVVDSLLKKGLYAINNVDNIKKGTVIISSHGSPIGIVREIRKKNLKLIDATCPFVKNAQDIVKGLKKEGFRIIIIGDKKHPEVKALLSLAGKEINSKRIGIISQTTQGKSNYLRGISDILKDDFSEVKIFNTICNDTSRRQESARSLLKECDVMIVVGGKNSANTRRLYEICKVSGVDSYHIEKDSELKKDYFKGKECAGVISGASTPDSMVEKVVKKIGSLIADSK